MTWYKTGTVSVTQNSNAVIGTGTAFIANSRVGDGFRGPDGRWYEVTNIASNTALSISPNYEGPTAAGGFYSIMPVQGYQKDLSDQVRAILKDYGDKLAALGTTGNYEILPVAKGGTGGTTQSAARIALGIKSGDVRWKSNTSNVTIPNGTYTTINWTNGVYGVGGIHSPTSNSDAFVLPVGIFLVSATLTYAYAANGRRGLRFTLGNAAFAGCFLLSPVIPLGSTVLTLTIIIRITTAGTILRVQGFQDSGADLNAPLSGGSNMEIYQLGDA